MGHKLKVCVRADAGYDNIDLMACEKKGAVASAVGNICSAGMAKQERENL